MLDEKLELSETDEPRASPYVLKTPKGGSAHGCTIRLPVTAQLQGRTVQIDAKQKRSGLRPIVIRDARLTFSICMKDNAQVKIGEIAAYQAQAKHDTDWYNASWTRSSEAKYKSM